MQVSQEAGKVVLYSHLLKNFPQFVLIHIVKGVSIFNEADVFFWNSLALSMIQQMLAIWSLTPIPFINPDFTSGSSQFMYCWSLAWKTLSITSLVCEMSATVRQFEHSLSLSFFGIGMKTDFSSPVATAGFSKFADIFNTALSQYLLLGFEMAQLIFYHLH